MNTPVTLEIEKILIEKDIDMPVSPTIAEVVMWLYEKHGIWVNVSIENNEDDKVSFYFSLLQNDDNEVVFKLRQSNYNSLLEAYDTAILFTLKNLI